MKRAVRYACGAGCLGIILLVVASTTPIVRWLCVWQIKSIASAARAHPEAERHARALLAIAQGPTGSSVQRFRAVYAVSEVGKLGPAASPIVLDLADLLDSPCDTVSQQAGRALENLRSVSGPAADRIAQRVGKDPRDATTWLAVRALGACGAPAEKHIPLLRTLDGQEPAMFSGAVARAIEAIEKDVANRKKADTLRRKES
jgi:hypothetical protein